MDSSSQKFNISLDFKIITLILLAVIGVMFFIWKPWDSQPLDSDRVIKVNGETTLKAEPDEFVFYPTYEIKDDAREVALKSLAQKSTEIIEGLKKAGVEEKGIKTNAADYESGIYWLRPEPQSTTYTLNITVTVKSKDLAQKVQDYLVTTSPTGQITPRPNFSEEKQNELETKAKNEAEKDARAKAEESAKNLGFKVGKVKSVTVNNASLGYYPMLDKAQAVAEDTKLTVQPGENDFYYQVEVVYYIR